MSGGEIDGHRRVLETVRTAENDLFFHLPDLARRVPRASSRAGPNSSLIPRARHNREAGAQAS
jgi:hypothetical protein